MKRWKLVTSVIIAVAVVATILAVNKKKLSQTNAGGIQDVYYVSVAKVEKKNLSQSLSLVGTVTAYNDVNILSETQGKITAVYVNVGDYKPAGSVLFQVDDELKKAAFMSAEANYDKAKKDYARFQELYKQKSATDAQLDQAKLGNAMAESQYIVAKRQYEDTKIKTPISGYVTSRPVDLGTMVQGAPQATLVANIVDISRLKVKLNVSENDAFVFKVGDPVSVTTDVYPGITFKGRIESISSKGDDAHTYPVEITIPNEKAHPLKAGMFARVEFTTLNNHQTLVISRDALVGSVRNPQVFVLENGIAKLRNIVVGDESGTDIQVLQGLNEGETVVVNGQNNLVENVKVQIVK